ncbi:hypothetical protein WA171_003278 [Blastocystis sp. BT1]
MSVNPGIGQDGVPILFVGEKLLLRRNRMRLISKIGNFNVKSDGILYLSTVRLIFIADKQTESFTGLDVPLMSIRNEKFNQPIFGSNNLSFNVVPQTGWGESYQFSVVLEFRNGGAQTFLRIFWKLMSTVNDVRNLPVATAVPTPAMEVASGNWVRTAFVDPSDPTYIYTSQPVQPTTYIPQNYPTPIYVQPVYSNAQQVTPVQPVTPQVTPMQPVQPQVTMVQPQVTPMIPQVQPVYPVQQPSPYSQQNIPQGTYVQSYPQNIPQATYAPYTEQQVYYQPTQTSQGQPLPYQNQEKSYAPTFMKIL